MGYAFLAGALTAEEWKLWNCLAFTSFSLRSFMVNSKADLDELRLNTAVSYKHA